MAEHHLRHGHARKGAMSRTYKSWAHMIERTTNPRARKWPSYGGRGIRVCDRWRDYALFLADMGERPAGTTLDRIDNEGHYEPGNCRWATPKVQANNRRESIATRRLSLDGTTRILAEWAVVLGVRENTIRERLRAGWSVERALTAPVRPYRHSEGATQ